MYNVGNQNPLNIDRLNKLQNVVVRAMRNSRLKKHQKVILKYLNRKKPHYQIGLDMMRSDFLSDIHLFVFVIHVD